MGSLRVRAVLAIVAHVLQFAVAAELAALLCYCLAACIACLEG